LQYFTHNNATENETRLFKAASRQSILFNRYLILHNIINHLEAILSTCFALSKGDINNIISTK